MIEQAMGRLVILGTVALIAFFLSLHLITLLRPWLARHALARPNSRSSHHKPTPQGGGFAVVIATLATVWGAIALLPTGLSDYSSQLVALTAAAVLLAVVGAVDDLRSLPAGMRLAVQFIAVAIVIAAFPGDLRPLPQVPWWIERAGLLLGGVWFVNLVNFMDGIDWMTVAELVPVAGAMVLLGLFGTIGLVPALVAAALLGAVLGFAPFNRPTAKLFLGDVGSLPVGVLLGWLLLQLASEGHLAAALILPLYYLADATVTLLRRIATGERIWQAHRTHFYQRAIDHGFTVVDVITRVFLVNLALATLALATVAVRGVAAASVALAAAVALATWLLVILARGKS